MTLIRQITKSLIVFHSEQLFYFRQDTYTDQEVLDTSVRFNCRSRVYPMNLYIAILEIAKQELIQKPYIMNGMLMGKAHKANSQ